MNVGRDVKTLAATADPLRLAVLRLLAAERELPASALADRFSVPAPRLSNHLAVLRDAGLVASRRVGRVAVYRLTDLDATAAFLDALDTLTGERRAADPEPTAFARARLCYDHLAGELGVLLYRRLVAADALTPGGGPESPLAPGPGLDAELTRLGVAPASPGRRHLAVGCLDSTAGTPHLGGALGAEILRSLGERGLLRRGSDGRTLIEAPVTESLLRGD